MSESKYLVLRAVKMLFEKICILEYFTRNWNVSVPIICIFIAEACTEGCYGKVSVNTQVLKGSEVYKDSSTNPWTTENRGA